ncbi:MAG: class I SAM-dependent methyltransferase [Desulfomonilaceae bacterium]
MSAQPVEIAIAGARIALAPLPGGGTKVTANLTNAHAKPAIEEWETVYSEDVIRAILDHDPRYWRLHGELVREESPEGIQRALTYYLLSFLSEKDFENKRILDFGCGCGASTLALSRLFPTAIIVGLDRLEECLKVCRLKARDAKCDRLSFVTPASDSSLPHDIGYFDYVVLCGVYEHLLPHERTALLRDLWSHLHVGGALFIAQTPNWYFPFETHITRYPLLHYLPRPLAYPIARRAYKRIWGSDQPWEELLRLGLHGASVREIKHILSQGQNRLRFLKPSRLGMNDSLDIWRATLDKSESGRMKELTFYALKAIKKITGLEIPPYITVAVQKEA